METSSRGTGTRSPLTRGPAAGRPRSASPRACRGSCGALSARPVSDDAAAATRGRRAIAACAFNRRRERNGTGRTAREESKTNVLRLAETRQRVRRSENKNKIFKKIRGVLDVDLRSSRSRDTVPTSNDVEKPSTGRTSRRSYETTERDSEIRKRSRARFCAERNRRGRRFYRIVKSHTSYFKTSFHASRTPRSCFYAPRVCP